MTSITSMGNWLGRVFMPGAFGSAWDQNSVTQGTVLFYPTTQCTSDSSNGTAWVYNPPATMGTIGGVEQSLGGLVGSAIQQMAGRAWAALAAQQYVQQHLGGLYGELLGGLAARQHHPYGDSTVGIFPANFQWQMQASPYSVPLTASAPIPPEQLRKIEERQAAIERRATKLLRSKLCGRELKALERFGFFDVRSPENPDVAYRIPESGMIVMFEKGAPVKRLCIHPAGSLPKGDRLLAIKLLVEAEPRELHRVANVHGLDRRDIVAVGMARSDRLERLPLMC